MGEIIFMPMHRNFRLGEKGIQIVDRFMSETGISKRAIALATILDGFEKLEQIPRRANRLQKFVSGGAMFFERNGRRHNITAIVDRILKNVP